MPTSPRLSASAAIVVVLVRTMVRAVSGVTPERTYQIVGGGLVIDEIMKALDVKEVEICPWALREGAILRWLDQFGRTRLGF